MSCSIRFRKKAQNVVELQAECPTCGKPVKIPSPFLYLCPNAFEFDQKLLVPCSAICAHTFEDMELQFKFSE
jgi:rRNA maturation protein Nop10